MIFLSSLLWEAVEIVPQPSAKRYNLTVVPLAGTRLTSRQTQSLPGMGGICAFRSFRSDSKVYFALTPCLGA